MFPDHSDVQNLKQLILLSQDNRTACQILLDLLNPHILELEKGFHYPQLITKILTIIQASCELGVSWQEQYTICFDYFDDGTILEHFLNRIDTSCMDCTATKQNLNQLIDWKYCFQNPLLPIKQEIVQVVYQLCHTKPLKSSHIYWFDDGRHRYMLYPQFDHWCWHNCPKEVTWKIY